MATTIVTKNGSGAPAASDLVAGELAVDLTNKRLYTEDSGGTVLELGTNPTTLAVDTDTLVVDATNNRVGIGAASPDQLLQLGSETYAANAIIKTQVDGSDAGDFDAGLHMRSHNDDFGGSIVLESRSATNDLINFKYHNNSAAGVSAMVIDATNGNVGIGISEPTYRIEAAATSGGNGLKITRGADSFFEQFQSTTGGVALAASGSAGYLALRTGTTAGTTTERMRIDASGNTTFKANNSAVGPIVTLENTATAVNGQAWGSIHFDSNDSSTGASGTRASIIGTSTSFNGDGNLTFSTAPANGSNTERMRIDSSGNLLVGTTTAAVANGTTAGIAATSGDQLLIGTSSDVSAAFNRITSDGDIVLFRKDGTTVGSIGTSAGHLYVGNGDTNLIFNDTANSIYPWDSSANDVQDATVDLGASTARFKDLYLSGASLAGAGSASSPSISFSGDTNTGLYSGGADNINFATGGTARAFMSATQFNMTGNGVFSGSISKGSGSFKIDHPLPEKTKTHHLVHSFVESPQADNIYRGKVDLVDGLAAVNIDSAAGMTEGTYVLLNTNTQCFTSNESGWTAVKGSVSGNTLTITAQDNTCTDTISWMVVGERHDQHMLDTEWTDENGRVIVEPLKES